MARAMYFAALQPNFFDRRINGAGGANGGVVQEWGRGARRISSGKAEFFEPICVHPRDATLKSSSKLLLASYSVHRHLGGGGECQEAAGRNPSEKGANGQEGVRARRAAFDVGFQLQSFPQGLVRQRR